MKKADWKKLPMLTPGQKDWLLVVLAVVLVLMALALSSCGRHIPNPL